MWNAPWRENYLRSHNIRYCLIEVVTKADLTVYKGNSDLMLRIILSTSLYTNLKNVHPTVLKLLNMNFVLVFKNRPIRTIYVGCNVLIGCFFSTDAKIALKCIKSILCSTQMYQINTLFYSNVSNQYFVLFGHLEYENHSQKLYNCYICLWQVGQVSLCV